MIFYDFIKRRRILFNLSIVICCLSFVSQNIQADTKINLDMDSSKPFKFSIASQHQQFINLDDINATLGSYDISALLTFDDEFIYFNHSGSVPPGSYLAKIEVVTKEGDLRIIYNQRLTFYRERWQANAELNATGSYKLDSEQNNAFINKVKRLSESALSLQAKQLGKNTHVKAQIDIQHSTDRNTLSGEKLEIPNFYIGIERPTNLGNIGFALGNQAIGSNGLVFNSFNRRGISAQLSDEQDRYALKAFVLNTDPEVSSKNNLLLANDKRERSSGVTVNFLPLETPSTRVSFHGGYLDGSSQLVGTGISFNSGLLGDESNSLSYGGKTWFIASNAYWFEEALSLQIEQAQSSIDSDGFGFGEPEQSDDASRYRIALKNRGELKDWLKVFNALFWEFSIQQQKVGADFYSMANIGLAGDLQSQQSSLQLSWTELQLLINGLKVQNNIDNSESIPTQTSRQNQIQLNYRPDISMDKSIWEKIGRPTFTLQFSETNREQDLSDAPLLGMDIDDKTRESKFSASFQKKNLSWSLQHSLNKYNNKALAVTPEGLNLVLPRSSTNNQFTMFTLNYSPRSNLSLSPTLQRSKYKEMDSGNWQTNLNLGFQANMSFLRDSLNLYLSHNLSKQDNLLSEGLLTQAYQTKQSSMTLSWLAKKAENHDPGLKVSFNSIWNERKASFQDVDDSYQLHLSVEIYWAAGVE